jgi:hypothetical protein
MTTSDQINELAAALAKAQGEMGDAVKDSANPFFKSRYADLASVWDACRAPLAKYEIAVVQSPSTEGAKVSVDTFLLHRSGQWMHGCLTVTAYEDSPPAVGSAITYLRRYSLQAFAGVAPADDDGEAAQGRGTETKPLSRGTKPVSPDTKPLSDGTTAVSRETTVFIPIPHPEGYIAWLDALRKIALEGTPALETAWNASSLAYRRHLVTAAPDLWATLKAIAAQQAA